MKYAHIVGWGCYLPDRIMTNDEIAQIVDTSDEWIHTRTGIRQRHIAGEAETTSTLAFEAAARALAVADMHPSQIDLIIVATSTPEHMFPSTACQVQDYLGATRAGAFDLSAACSGFVYGLEMAAQAIATGSVRNAIVIGAETMSRVLDWEDRSTCILFGDGAGAVVLRGSGVPGGFWPLCCIRMVQVVICSVYRRFIIIPCLCWPMAFRKMGTSAIRLICKVGRSFALQPRLSPPRSKRYCEKPI